jgi:hypothetical protein
LVARGGLLAAAGVDFPPALAVVLVAGLPDVDAAALAADFGFAAVALAGADFAAAGFVPLADFDVDFAGAVFAAFVVVALAGVAFAGVDFSGVVFAPSAFAADFFAGDFLAVAGVAAPDFAADDFTVALTADFVVDSAAACAGTAPPAPERVRLTTLFLATPAPSAMASPNNKTGARQVAAHSSGWQEYGTYGRPTNMPHDLTRIRAQSERCSHDSPSIAIKK